jgi:hypothetical protein
MEGCGCKQMCVCVCVCARARVCVSLCVALPGPSRHVPEYKGQAVLLCTQKTLLALKVWTQIDKPLVRCYRWICLLRVRMHSKGEQDTYEAQCQHTHRESTASSTTASVSSRHLLTVRLYILQQTRYFLEVTQPSL